MSLAHPPEIESQCRQLWRRPDGVERFFCALFDQSAGSGRVVFIARFSGPARLDAIERALRLLTGSCPRSRLSIQQTRSGDYEFLTSPAPHPASIDFQTVHDAAEGYQFAAKLSEESFPHGTEPVLRWVVLSTKIDDTFQLVGLAHHALFDAASMTILIQRFIEVLDAPAVPHWDWPEPPLPVSRWKTALPYFSGIVRYLRDNFFALRACRSLPREPVSHGTCIAHSLSMEETARLTDACRHSGTTVTALLGVVGTLAVREHYGKDIPCVDLTIPINARRFLARDVADRTLGTLIVVLNFAVDFRRPVSLQDEARRIATTLRAFVEHEGPLRFLQAANRLVPKRVTIRKGQPTCISSNSLGRITAPVSTSGVRMLECGWFGGLPWWK